MRTCYVRALALAAVLTSATASAAAPVAGDCLAVQLDGVDDYVQAANVRPAFSTDTVTLELWFNAAAAGVIVEETGGPYNTSPGWHDSQIEILDTGQVLIRVWYSSAISLGTVAFNTWHHAVLRYNVTSQRLDGFLDGVASASSPIFDRQSPWENSQQYYYSLGSGDAVTNLGSGAYFSGMVEEFRVWNVARTPAEIWANMNTPLVGNEPGLVHYLRCDDRTGVTATDSSPNAWNATLENGAAFVVTTGPITASPAVNAVRGQDTVITLTGWDADGDPLTATITSLPTSGTLYQYNGGVRGGSITGATPIAVLDPGRRVIYAAPGVIGADSFTYTLNDGALTSNVATMNITITKPLQTVTFAPVPDKIQSDPPFTVSATASSGLPVVISLVSGPATFDAATNTVTITGFGVIRLQAAQAGDANYEPALAVLDVPVKRTQTIDFPQPPDIPFAGGSTLVYATATSNLSVTLTVVSGPGTLDGNSLTATDAGAIVVRASQAGDNNWGAASDVDRTVNVLAGTLTEFVYDGPLNGDDYTGDWWTEPAQKCIVTDAAGNVYVTGSSDGGPLSGTDYLTVKFDNAGNKLWEARYTSAGGEDYDAATSIALDSSGNVYVTGYAHGSWNTGTPSIVTVKYDADGAEQWVQEYRSPAASWHNPYGLVVDAAGSAYVLAQVPDNNNDFATIKYDSAGVEQWVRLYDSDNSSRNDEPYGITLDSAGNVCVTGASYLQSPTGWNWEFRTVSYAPDGTMRWDRHYRPPFPPGGSSYAEAYAIASDSNGNVYVTGYSYDGNSYSATTLKYDSAGAQLWAARDNLGDSYAYAIATDAAGNCVVTGYAYDGWSYAFRTIKYNTDGVAQWAAVHPRTPQGYDYGEAVVLDGQGNVYVAGYSYSQLSSYDYLAVKYNADGVQQWEMRWTSPGNEDDEAYAIALDQSGNVFVGGSSYNGSDYDYVVVKCSQVAQSIDFPAIPDHTVGDRFQLAATASSGLPVTFSLVSGPATIDGDILEVTGSGPITVRASQPGAGVYLAAPDVEQTFNGKANQTITLGPLADKAVTDPPFAVSATASSGLVVTFSIVSGPATLAGDTITLTGAGVVVVRASQAGDALFNPAPDVDVSFTVCAAPVITSGPAAMPNPALVGHAVQLSCAATDALAISYTWDFGDGTGGSGAAPMHTYAAAGAYVVKVTVTNSVGAYTSSTLDLVVGAYSPMALAKLDSDLDGFSDEIELAIGSDPYDAASTPFGLAPVTPTLSLAISRMQIKLNFASPVAHDDIKIQGWLPLRAGFNPLHEHALVDVGGVVQAFDLDEKGRSSNSGGTFMLKLKYTKGVALAQTAKYAVRLRQGTFAAALKDEGLVNADQPGIALTVPVTLIFGGQIHQAQAPQGYKAKASKYGVTR